MNSFETIGYNISEVLRDKNMSQTDLAEEMGVSKQVMSKIINGQKAINVLEVKSIAKILNIDVNLLIVEKDYHNQEKESLVKLMGVVNNNIKDELDFLNTIIDELDYLEDLLNE
ncbi:MAG TPA: helix-turn-helix transcriptional regulator [Bacillota bacterium]|nr:helix-turn-helix transcriptional regulator [Bacillota bacterium]